MTILEGTGLSLGLMGEGGDEKVSVDAVFLKQVHGTGILFEPSGGEEGDGMIFRRGEQLPGLKVADCLPVFAVWDNHIGAAHAGWRGLSAGIVEKLIRSVEEPLRFLVLGPCICTGCYEVQEDVRKAVTSTDPAGENGHPPGRIDLRGSALRRVRMLCPFEFGVWSLDRCTKESPALYSHRRDGTSRRNILWLAETASGEHIQPPVTVNI